MPTLKKIYLLTYYESQFQCFDGKTCIHKLQYCDMYLDCPDKSLCNTFTFSLFQAVMSRNSSVLTGRPASTNSNTATCISTARINHYVIHSHFDFYSACNESQFQCFDGKTCIHKLQYCDMYLHCPHKSLCTCNSFTFWLYSACNESQFQCFDGKTCIHKLQYCDMYLDCPDKSLCTCNTFTFWLLFSL